MTLNVFPGKNCFIHIFISKLQTYLKISCNNWAYSPSIFPVFKESVSSCMASGILPLRHTKRGKRSEGCPPFCFTFGLCLRSTWQLPPPKPKLFIPEMIGVMQFKRLLVFLKIVDIKNVNLTNKTAVVWKWHFFWDYPYSSFFQCLHTFSGSGIVEIWRYQAFFESNDALKKFQNFNP